MRLLFERTSRMLEEARGLDALMAEVEWLSHVEWGLTGSADVRVNFDITVQGKVYEAELVYPSLFPEAPAFVRPRKPDQSWSGHQYLAGTLCLEWGPDNWHPGVTGAALVRNTFLLMAYEVVGPALGMEAPSRHELTTGQRLRGVVNRFLVTPELKAAIAAAPANLSPLTVATNARLGALVAMATKVGEASAPNLAGVPPEICDPNALGSWLRTGWVIKVDEWASLAKDAAPAAVHDFLVAKGLWPYADDADRTWYLLLVDAQGGLRPMALVLGEAARVYEYTLLDASSDVATRQPERHTALAEKKVAIVGLGSLGSKLAVSLARAGVTKFYLVDDDVLLPANLVRHQLDWWSVGNDKVEAVKAAILLVRPDAEVQSKNFRFAGQESSSYNTVVLEQIAACDLVIDATASPKVFSSVAAICSRRRVPCIWGEIYAGGIGAQMARSIPGHDGDPLTVRAAIHQYLAGKPEAPFKRAQGYDVEDEQEVFVGGDAEVSHLAASMTQLAVDALVGAGQYKFPVPAYLMGYQLAWIFEAPFDTHPIACPHVESSEPALDAEAAKEALGELVSKFAE